MRRWGGASGVLLGGVLLSGACLMLAACGSSTAKAAPPTSTAPPAPSTSTHVTTTTKPDPVAADTVAQYKLTAALNAAKSIYSQSYDFTGVTPASLTALVPNVVFTDLPQASKKTIGVLAQDKNDVLLVTKSASGRWYCVTDNDTDGVSFGVGTSLSAVNSNGECQLDAWPPPGTAPVGFG
jgi:hypothetical protein